MSTRDWGIGDVRGGKPLPGSSPTGASEELFGVLQTFLRSPQFFAMARQHGLVPVNVGDIKMTATTTAPTGWLLCDGSSYEREAYPELFKVIGTSFGGDALNFSVPDMRGAVPVGVHNPAVRAGISLRPIGLGGGEEAHTLTTAELAAHSHSVTDPGHRHGLSINFNPGSLQAVTFAGATFNDMDEINTFISSHTTGISINNAGLGNAHNNMQPYTVVQFCIFAGGG